VRAPDPGTVVYRGLRQQALDVDPETIGVRPTADLPQVFGVVVDVGCPALTATLVSFAEGSTSLYTSTGGGVIGCGAHENVRAAGGRLLRSAEELAGLFAPAPAINRLPVAGRIRITLLTHADGPLRADAAEADLKAGRHPVAPVYRAAHAVLAALRRIDRAR
jgi:hypothetical protein